MARSSGERWRSRARAERTKVLASGLPLGGERASEKERSGMKREEEELA
jgi:hypothetical protein